MAALTRAELKALWIQGYLPLETDYDDVWDSFFGLLDNTSDDITEGSTKLLLTTGERSAILANTAKVSYSDSGNVVLKTTDQTIEGVKSFAEGITVDSLLTYLVANGLKFGDGDTALYESADGTLNIYIEGAIRWALTTAHLTANIVGGIDLVRTSATATDPCYAFLSDSNTGLGRAGAGQWSLIAASVEVIRGTTTGAYIKVIKSGATQAAAGANPDEVWKTLGHATLPDNVIMHGV